MTDMTQTIDVDVPVTTAYNQWTQFTEFPKFMDGVDEITQTSDRTTHWKISIGGVTREFDAEITEQTPDQRIAWKSVDGTGHAGSVDFHKLTDSSCRLSLIMDTEPHGLLEKAADAVGLPNHEAKKDLKNFKQFIESQGTATGTWRGEVPREG